MGITSGRMLSIDTSKSNKPLVNSSWGLELSVYGSWYGEARSVREGIAIHTFASLLKSLLQDVPTVAESQGMEGMHRNAQRLCQNSDLTI